MTDTRMFDEAAFFQTCSGCRRVDADLERYVGLDFRLTRSAAALNFRQLKVNKREAAMFGQPGSDQYAQTLANAVDLGQIAELIAAQEGGKSGVLLNDGRFNIFPVLGKDSALYSVLIRCDVGRWDVHCYPFRATRMLNIGHRVFSN